MLDVVIVGAGALGREVLEIARAAYAESTEYRIKGFLSDDLQVLDGFSTGCPIIGPIHGYEIQPQDRFVMAIGSIRGKKKVAEYMMERGAEFISLIDPRAVVFPSARIGKGVVFYPMSFAGADVEVGDFCLVNLYATCGHDAVIGAYSELCPYSVVGGHVTVGPESMLAMHAVIASNRSVGRRVKISASSSVLENVPDDVLVEGVPGKVVKKLQYE